MVLTPNWTEFYESEDELRSELKIKPSVDLTEQTWIEDITGGFLLVICEGKDRWVHSWDNDPRVELRKLLDTKVQKVQKEQT